MNILITGGLGFIGTNTAIYYAKKGNTITVVDNYSRPNIDHNEQYLISHYPTIQIVPSDINDLENYKKEFTKADVIIHLAGQTAVTTSIKNPSLDFKSNMAGSFTILEAVRTLNPSAILLYSSTNKVYGDLNHHNVVKNERRLLYENKDCPYGVGEDERIDFISPYGCSKGSVDLYMQDYARIYGLKTVVFRQSCIYGPFQMGVEDQGWVAHFSKQFLLNRPITIFGDGYQVRDLLFVEDLINAYDKAIQQIEMIKGEVYNIGGGTDNAFSLLHIIEILKKETGNSVPVTFNETRLGDQKYFISANKKIYSQLLWKPITSFKDGVKKMIEWQKLYLTK